MNSQNTILEFHIIQSFPVTCLNRDDVGAPKSAIVGGVSRARVSSQCWKRQVRLALRDQGIKLASRTKQAEKLFSKACIDAGAEEEVATACGQKLEDELVDDTLLFISETEANAFATYAKEQGFDPEKLKKKELEKIARKALNPALDSLDIALFGRMIAKAPTMNVEAASSFSHAISTHKVSNEVEFFTALDDLQEEPGSAHMGSLEYNSATYYRYVSLDLGQLQASLGEGDLKASVEAFTKALFVAIPSARQTTQSGACPWDYCKVLVRHGQRLQVPFDKPIKSRGDGYSIPSIDELKAYLDKRERMIGSLYGKRAEFEWGEDENFSIDDLFSSLGDTVTSLQE